MSNVLSIKLENIFEAIRDNNQFTVIDGEVIWSSDWHDEEIQPFNNAFITWQGGEGRLVDGWSIVVDEGELTEGPYRFKYPYYECGTISEAVGIVDYIKGIEKGSNFPLFLFVENRSPLRGDDLVQECDFLGYWCVKNTTENPKLRAKQSYEEKLNPLYDLLIRYCEYNAFVTNEKTASIIPQWGVDGQYSNEGNVFQRLVDALEINIKNFKFYNNG